MGMELSAAFNIIDMVPFMLLSRTGYYEHCFTMVLVLLISVRPENRAGRLLLDTLITDGWSQISILLMLFNIYVKPLKKWKNGKITEDTQLYCFFPLTSRKHSASYTLPNGSTSRIRENEMLSNRRWLCTPSSII